MKHGLITLADVPELDGSSKPRSQIVVARLDDKLYDPRYGRFSIAQSDVDGWKRNLSETFGGRVAIDFDHSSDRGRGTKAAAWITGLSQQGKTVTADVEWTPTGAKSIRDGDYKYISPTFVPNFVDEHKESHGRALIGAALTNRPVLRKGMPTLSLSRDEFPELAVDPKRERKRARQLAKVSLAAGKSAAPRDSRPHMADATRADLIKLLALSEDADTDAIQAAVSTALGDEPSTESETDPAEPTTLSKKERKAAKKLARDETPEGTVTLSADQVADLMAKANAGAAAATQLAEQTFKTAWDKALSEGRAAPSQEETMKALFLENSDLAIKTLDSFVPIVPVKPQGSGEATEPAPDGMDAERYALHAEAKQLAAKKLEATPSLDPAEAYILATQEIEERKFTLEHPGI